MNLVFFLEEPSARELLKGLLKRVVPKTVTPRYVVFEGKQDLEKQLVGKLRGWRQPNSAFVVLRDQDSSDCGTVKRNLVALCRQAGRPEATVRVACRELESWYLGDLAAVETGLGLDNLVRYSNKKQYRDPDEVGSPSKELEKLTRGKYQKVSGSRKIGPHLSLDSNRSHSFSVFLDTIKEISLTMD